MIYKDYECKQCLRRTVRKDRICQECTDYILNLKNEFNEIRSMFQIKEKYEHTQHRVQR